jgi:ribosomal protein S18 acetylase RimI-like enzyme
MIVFREGRVEDAAAIDALFRASFNETFAHLYDPRDLAAFFAAFTPEAWRAELADGDFAFRLAEEDGRLAGYAKLASISLPVEPEGPAAELRQLYIAAPWRGAGVAQSLIGWVTEAARGRGADWLYLSVFVDNHRARRFYDRYGFEEAGHYAFMVGNHADEDLIMRARL